MPPGIYKRKSPVQEKLARMKDIILEDALSRCFIDGRLRVDLNGEIYWIRLEK